MISSGERLIHRTAITAADSGTDPTAWADAPSAITDMSGYEVLRIFPVLNSGSLTALTIRVISKRGSTVHLSVPTAITADFTDVINIKGYAGEPEIYVRIDTISGSSPNVSLFACGVNES